MRRVFLDMRYDGNPPRSLILSADKLRIVSSDPEYLDYLDAGIGGKHYASYQFEKDAARVKNRVLAWWAFERDDLPFVQLLKID